MRYDLTINTNVYLKTKTMEVLRKVKHFKLNKGDGMARGLYNVVDEVLMTLTPDKGVSLWFDKDEADRLKKLSTDDFVSECKSLTE